MAAQRHLRRPDRGEVLLAALALLAGTVAALMATTVFPHGSSNNDEGTYLLQARTLAHGHLFPRFSGDGRAGLPWFFQIRGHHYVPKYLPVFPAFLAASIAVTGRYWPVLALFAAALPVACHALGRAVGLGRGAALAAAAVVALSPLTLVESGLVLTYVPFATLMALLWLLAFGLLDGNHGRWGVRPLLVGLLAVICAALRPFDTLLLLLPFVVAFLRRAPRRARASALVVAGALPLVVLLGAYDAAATGSPFRLPFNAAEGSDSIGFGVHRLFPEDSAHRFGPLEAIKGSYEHFLRGPLTWFGAGLLLVAALGAALALRVLRRGPWSVPLLAQSVVVFLAGYFFFWGPWNASVLWGGPHILGPFYALAILVPVVLCAMPVLVRASRATPVALAVLAAGAVALNGVQIASALAANVRNTGRTDALLAAVGRVPSEDLLLVSIDPSYARHPVSVLDADPPRRALAGAVDPASLPADRSVSEVVLDANFYGVRGRPAFAVVRERRLTGPSLSLAVAAPPPGWILAVASASAAATTCAGPATVSLGAAPPRVVCPAPTGVSRPLRGFHGQQSHCPTAECLDVSLFRPRGGGRYARQTVRRFVVGGSAGRWTVLVDAATGIPQPFAGVTVARSEARAAS